MVELVCREMQHDLEAYEDFCVYRSQIDTRRATPEEQREHDLQIRRRSLHQRMNRRRSRRKAAARTKTKTRSPFSLW